MSDEQPMSRAYAPFWIGLSIGGSLFLAGFVAWAALFGIGGGPAPTQQQAARAPATAPAQQTTGQAPAEQPAQPEKK